MNSIVFTLYEGHYEIGVGALINSLANHNFKGKIAVGYRGRLPDWLTQLKKKDNKYFINQTIELNFYPLSTNYHLAYYKPFFMLELFDKYPECNHVFYFDPDICNKCHWDFYEKWVNFGLAVCVDNCYGIVPSHHPWRHEWIELAKSLNYEQKQFLDFYFNSGFVAAKRSDISVVNIWKELTIALGKSGYDITQLKKISRENSIITDQDVLNAAIMFSDVICSPIGPDGMDFTGGGFLMSHAVGSVKPWRKQFIHNLLTTGNIPSLAETEFFKNLVYPINLYPPMTRFTKKIDLKLAKIIGRLVGH
ncbi:hypothetical protein [Calothrix sp. 336/3]|uniref:hypothetical protein n=1 Tax=Calothrix sp. 336/3 TaxID=1337936 RepID=UPI0004E3D34C|nr:hypothetical protein [Calothrix sp. 336/3]AKG23973.1 hypothetical protein IJ00_24080 [Calothrix sp. 336/3]